MTPKEKERYADYQVCGYCEEMDPIAVVDLTERQAKIVLCKMIDKLEKIEAELYDFKRRHSAWREVRAPK